MKQSLQGTKGKVGTSLTFDHSRTKITRCQKKYLDIRKAAQLCARRVKAEKRLNWMDSTHEFELFKCGEATGEIAQMTGKEAKTKNFFFKLNPETKRNYWVQKTAYIERVRTDEEIKADCHREMKARQAKIRQKEAERIEKKHSKPQTPSVSSNAS